MKVVGSKAERLDAKTNMGIVESSTGERADAQVNI
jgi:hypothetical protein